MPYSTELYRNLPLYARLSDQESGRVLEHVCNAIQPNLDLIRDRITNRGYIYDLQTTPPVWLDWLQQFVGGAPIGDQWQGLGLNPDWNDAQKRRVLGRLWRYWQVKGTEWGIREAIALWLQFEAAHTARFEIRLPFGKTPTSTLPNWWSYETSYDAHLYQLYPERQHLGSGDYLPGALHQPKWLALQQSEWTWNYDTVWSDRLLSAVVPEPSLNTSHLGPQRPWEHFYLETDQEWKAIAPDIYRLNPEIWSSFALPTVFIWLLETLEPLSLEENRKLPRQKPVTELTIDGFQYNDVFPFQPAPATEQVQIIETVTEFGLEGCTYNDWWASLGGHIIPATARLTIQTVVIEGVYPGAEYERDWYSAVITPTETQTTLYDGNYQIAFSYNDNWQETQWYFPPGEETQTLTLAPQAYGSLPYYCPTLSFAEAVVDSTLPGETQSYPGTLWTATPQTVIERIETTVSIAAVPCISGMLAEIEVGTETILVAGDPGRPSSQLLVFAPGSTTTIEVNPGSAGSVGFAWGNWWLSVQGTRLTPIDMGSLAPIDLSTVASLPSIAGAVDTSRTPNLVQSQESALFGSELWYSVPAVAPITQALTIPDGWQLEAPVQVATYESLYGSGYTWYVAGRSPQPPTSQTRPVKQLVSLCNVVDNWTLREILVWNEYLVELPEADLDYSLTQIYPLLGKVLDGNQWTLLLEAVEQVVVLSPTTLLWVKDETMQQRASYYSKEEGFTQLVLEFIVQPQTASKLRSLTLVLGQQAMHSRQLDQLDYSPPGCFGFRFLLPMQTTAMVG